MTENDKKAIIRYLNLVSDELLRLREKANDLDDQITENKERLTELVDLISKRLAISKRIIKNHESIHNMIDYVEAEGYEIIWEGYKVVDIIKKGDKENDNWNRISDFEKDKRKK